MIASQKENKMKAGHYIVAIGASAGGLEAIHEFFDNVPESPDFSYIIIQHLSSDYKSLLVELVSKHTHMRVFEAENNIAVQKQCVYVIPNNKIMTISHGRLQLANKIHEKGPNTAIDIFFHSLAEDKKEAAVAVVLSGTGSDGTKGIGSIKECGGLVLVQDTITEKFDGMPQSAITTGLADQILAPEMMPESIFSQLIGGDIPVRVLSKGKIQDHLLTEIFKKIYSTSGYDFHYYKTPTIIRRIARRMGQVGVKDLQQYIEYLGDNKHEVRQLGKDFLIGVTKFFRDKAAFDFLGQEVIARIIQEKKEGDVLKVWVCACSTGEEAYSLAIAIDRQLLQLNKMLEVKIFATDLDESSIEIAAKNAYPTTIEDDIEKDVLERYFNKTSNKYSVIPRIRKQIVFAKHNIIKDPPFINNDLISCRNMLIYMSSVLQDKVLSKLYFSLNNSGFLFLGPSETASAIREGVEEIEQKWKIYKKTGNWKITTQDFYRSDDSLRPKRPSLVIPRAREAYKALSDDFKEMMLQDLNYCAFYIDNNYEIKEAVGNFSKYLSLPEKRLNLNLLRMLPKELGNQVNSAIRVSWRDSKTVSLKNVRYRNNSSEVLVNVSVKPPLHSDGKRFTLVVLGEMQVVARHEELIQPAGGDEKLRQEQNDYILELESELNETRSNLQMAIEGLETTNEELQSSNEELLSANEELQSSNEELQSLNEELHTLNTEHQLKIKELIELNDDLNNYFRSTDIGQLFLDVNLNIRKFNPAASKFVNLIQSDIGRPFGHLSTNLYQHDLLDEIRHVQETSAVVEKEFSLNDGRSSLIRIFPYIRQDKTVDGVIITFVDITAVNRLNSIIKAIFNTSLSSILAFTAIRNSQGKITDFQCISANQSSYNILRVPAGLEINGRLLRDIAPQLLQNGYFEKYVEVVESDKPLNSELKFDRDGRPEWYQITAVRMLDGIVITITEITDKKLADLKLKRNYNELIATRESLKKLNLELEDSVLERTRELTASEERFRVIAESTNDSIWDWDLVKNKIWWNDSFYQQFGYKNTPETNTATFWLDHVHPSDRARVSESVYGSINEGQCSWSCEYRFRRADGTYAYIYGRGQVMQSEYNTPYRMLGSMLDITKIYEAESKLASSEAKFRRIFESNMLGMVFSSFDGKIQEANDYFLDMIGYSRKELDQGAIFWKEITPREYQESDERAVTQLKTLGVGEPYEKEYLHKSGRRVAVLIGSAAVNEDERINAVTYIIDISEKREAERKERELQRIIKKQQDEFASIFMHAPALISIRRGPQLNLEFYNTAIARFLGRDDLHGKTMTEVSSEYKTTAGDEILMEVYRTGKPYTGKSFHVRYDRQGTGRLEDGWFDFIHQPVYDNQGNIDGVASFGFDVTDIVKANLEIKRNEDRFRFLANSVPVKVWTAQPDGSIDYFNKIWLDYTGASFEELRGWGWKNVIHPDDWERNVTLWEHSIRTGEDFEMERRIQQYDGTYRWHLTRGIAQRDNDDRITMWVGTSTDIHDQKLLSEELKVSEHYFRQLADDSPFLIWKVDENGNCNYVNRPWLEFTGLSFNDSLGNGWGSALHPQDFEREYKLFKECFRVRKNYSSKFRLRRRDGEYRWVLAQSNPLITGEFEGYLGSLTDITEQELAQQALRLLMQKKDEFMSIASHELKTPITSMKASLQIVQRITEKSQRVKELEPFIEKANRQVNKLSGLVEDLLDVTKIHAGKLIFNHSQFRISEAIHDCVEQIENNHDTHTVDLMLEEDVLVYGDKHRLEQVIINFLSNAVKYSPGSERVVLAVRREREWVTVNVRDFGIGIPEDKINFVFDRFFRVQESSQKFSGLGLGLYISSEIVKRHGGEVGVKSQEGKGSEFWFRIPVNASDTSA